MSGTLLVSTPLVQHSWHTSEYGIWGPCCTPPGANQPVLACEMDLIGWPSRSLSSPSLLSLVLPLATQHPSSITPPCSRVATASIRHPRHTYYTIHEETCGGSTEMAHWLNTHDTAAVIDALLARRSWRPLRPLHPQQEVDWWTMCPYGVMEYPTAWIRCLDLHTAVFRLQLSCT